MKKLFKHTLIVILISIFAFIPWLYNKYRIHNSKNKLFKNGRVPGLSSCPKCRIGVKRPEWINVKTIDKF